MNQVLCKWVSEDMTTMNDTKWKVGVPNELPENKNLWLCSKGLFHYCKHPLIAVMFKNFHRCKSYTKLYEVLPEGMIVDGWDKCGSTKLTLIQELEIPSVNNIQRIAFSILCAKEVYKEPKFVDWANNWLSGKNRSQDVAEASEADADAADADAAEAAAYAAAAYAAYAAAAYAADAATDYITARVHGSIFSSIHAAHIDLISLAYKAMEIQ